MERNELAVKGIALDKDNHLPILLLAETEGPRVLPVPIGPFEASAIIIQLEDISPPRPITHDLLMDFLARHRFKIKRVELYGYMGDKILARIEYGRRFRTHRVESRPSDAVALALRQGAPIYCVPELLDGIPDNGENWEEVSAEDGQFLYLGNDGSV